MDVLVIGGSRFSGRHIINLLLDKEHNVTVLNRGQSEKKLPPFYKSIEYQYPKGVTVLHADRTKKDEFTKVLDGKNFEAIIDTCAMNERDIQNVIDIAGKNLQNYVFISTAGVYDENKINFLPITEDTPIGSDTDDYPIEYTRDKRRAENHCIKSLNESGFPVTIIRPVFIYGPNNPMYREVYFFDRINDKKPIYMPGNGDYLNDFVHSKDVAWLATIPLEKKNAIGQTFNATGGGAISLNRYVSVLGEIIGKETEVIYYDPKILEKEELKPENWNQMFPFFFNMHLFVSKEKIVKDLGFKPIEFIEGITTTYEWYQENKHPDWKGEYTLDKKIAKEIK
ncbi:MAG: NAD-dependent epimerase/dehydratase family protein [Asgard group archaeon]|nr:NAD-dependent epimerase/dehydratase family protein [Asgard group archaeon]